MTRGLKEKLAELDPARRAAIEAQAELLYNENPPLPKAAGAEDIRRMPVRE
jgi:hypothetical protein